MDINTYPYIHISRHTHTYTHKNICTMPLPSSIWLPRAPDSVWTLTLSHSSGSEGEGGILGVSILHGGGRGELDPQTKAPVVAGVCRSGWVMGQPHTLTLFLSLAFFSSSLPSISLFYGEEDLRGTMAFFCPHYHPNSGDAYWTGATASQGVPLTP